MKSMRSMIRAPIRMDRVTDDRSGCSRQGAARQAANNKGTVRQVRFYDFTPARTISGRGAFYLGSLSGSPFPVSPCGKTAGSPRPRRYGAGRPGERPVCLCMAGTTFPPDGTCCAACGSPLRAHSPGIRVIWSYTRSGICPLPGSSAFLSAGCGAAARCGP